DAVVDSQGVRLTADVHAINLTAAPHAITRRHEEAAGDGTQEAPPRDGSCLHNKTDQPASAVASDSCVERNSMSFRRTCPMCSRMARSALPRSTSSALTMAS